MIAVLLTDMFWSCVAIFASCSFGQKMSDSFHEIEYEINQLKWYRLPIHIQRLMPIFVVNALTPVNLCVIGTISCDLITFKKVGSENAISYADQNFLNKKSVRTTGCEKRIFVFYGSSAIWCSKLN